MSVRAIEVADFLNRGYVPVGGLVGIFRGGLNRGSDRIIEIRLEDFLLWI